MAIVPKLDKIIYDGTNGQDVADTFDSTLVSDDGQTLVIAHPTGQMTFNQNDVMLYQDVRSLGGNVDPQGTFSSQHYAVLFEEI